MLIGVPAFWLQLPLVVHLVLSYPTGRIGRSGERRLVAVMAAGAAAASVVLLFTKTPVPLCADWCGPSPVRVVDDAALYLRLRGTALVIMLGLAFCGLVLLVRRTISSPRERRRSSVTTVVAGATVCLLSGSVINLLAAYRDDGRPAEGDATLSLLIGAAMVGALPLFFVAGLARQWLAFAAFGDVLPRARHMDPGDLEAMIARATGDPMLRIAYPTPEGWKNSAGRPYLLPAATEDIAVRRVGEPPRAALVHSPALAEEPNLFRSTLALIGIAFPPRTDQEPPPMPPPHVFISYLREDTAVVDRLATALRDHGIEVWLDRTHLIVGDRWPRVVKAAIRDGNFFIACFSPAYARRSRTHMNEEMTTAVEELRLRPRDRRWFLPVKLEPCAIPHLDLGAGETLETLHHVDLSQDWDAGVHQLLRAIEAGDVTAADRPPHSNADSVVPPEPGPW
ncbi:toll/interleukin-1 receptor domain-containing protein [Actinoplanes sp. TRM 88003]|uniref:Toll/interleukin-1 receptor domain-containing protein n=1 Tax=Paractinoplanes aksuensis TaxID=2939490 RepID=A0ABT1E2Z3_9ACTN|nr:toll/interleukin-1 receptor domain-containing protein [Actinoplanes aksuensis]MCO8277503.1 toll/interleukin-1 receptor domain-containing protein [Actinoplanes aksuensis]